MTRIERSCHCEHGLAAGWPRMFAKSRSEIDKNQRNGYFYKYTPPRPLEASDAG